MNAARLVEPPLVLVVDDEPLIRLVNMDLLSEAGFDVLEAGSGEEALQLLECENRVRVVFTDVEMPGHIDGFALAGKIATQWPGIGVVVTSGRKVPACGFDARRQRFLPKPYSLDKVVKAIGEALNCGAPR